MPVPLIGLTSYAENAQWAVWQGKAAVVGWVYVDAIHRVEPSVSDKMAGDSAPADRGDLMPTFGTRSGDRTTLAAGAVLGAAALMAAGSVVRPMLEPNPGELVHRSPPIS